MKNLNASNQHIIDDLCDCLLRAFCRVPIDQNLNAEAIKSALEHQIRTQQNIAPWIKELIQLDDERITKH